MKRWLGFMVLLCRVALCLCQDQTKCAFENTAFVAGENLECNFYFNWKFVWVKAGAANLSVTRTVYQSKPALCMRLLSSTNSRADAFFKMRDTLETIFTPQLQPLYYRKGSLEGKRYRVDEIFYSYEEGKVMLHQRRQRSDRSLSEQFDTLEHCVYDMMSLLARARSFDYASLKKGAELIYPVATGTTIENQKLIYKGKKTVKSDDDKQKFRCLEISLVAQKKGKDRELITFYVTDDNNHLPVLLDLNLNFGSAKALLTETKGNRYPLSSKVYK